MKRYQFHGEVGSEPHTGSARATRSARGPIPPAPAKSAIGPIDPAQLMTLGVRVWNRRQTCLLVPACLPLSQFHKASLGQGCRWGCLAAEDDAEAGEVRSVPKVVNYIYFALDRELWGERDPGRYAWVVGFLLGYLAVLAETERLLALVGMAHLCFLLSFIPLEVWSCNSRECVNQMGNAHRHAIRAYRARVRFYRELGRSFQEAQRLALTGCGEEVVLRNTLNGSANHEREDR